MMSKSKLVIVVCVSVIIMVCLWAYYNSEDDKPTLDMYLSNLDNIDEVEESTELLVENIVYETIPSEVIESEIEQGKLEMEEHTDSLYRDLNTLLVFTDEEAKSNIDPSLDVADCVTVEATDGSFANYSRIVYGVQLAFGEESQNIVSLSERLGYDNIFECDDTMPKHYFYANGKLCAVWAYGDIGYVYDCTREAREQGIIE